MEGNPSVLLPWRTVLLGALWVAIVGPIACRGYASVPEAEPNVILITIDTVRADHLGCYGDKQAQTPNIDAFAAHAVRCANAFTPVPITLPSHTCIMTGMFPLSTGMHDFSGNKLRADSMTLARLLQEHGYSTAAFVGAEVLDSRFGLNQGFETYYDHFEFSPLSELNLDEIERPGDQVVNLAIDWLRSNPRRPIFLWIHLYDAHFPYRPHEPYATRFRAHPYDGEIAFVDAQIGRLFSFLREKDMYNGSVIALAADHGEGLGEHGEKNHGFFIYNSTLHVPLILHIPGAKPRVVDDSASLVDVMPTILQVLGIPIPASVEGRSLLADFRGKSHGGDAAPHLYSETYLPLLHFGWSSLRGLEWRGLKYIEAPRPELYDLKSDPHELKNLYATRKPEAREMQDQLTRLVRRYTPANGRSASAEKTMTDPALLARLRSLGYVAVSGGSFTEASGKPLDDPKDRIEVYDVFSQAMADGQHGRYKESLRLLAEAEKSDPTLMPVRYLKALDYYRLKDFRRAVENFQSALALDPKFALATYYLGLAQGEMGDLDGATASFRRALELDPTNFAAAYDLGAALLKQNHVEGAVDAFLRATGINPQYAQAYVALGEVYLYQRRTDDAVRALERAVELAPQSRKAHYNLGRAYQAQGRTSDAQREFDKSRSN